MAGPGSATRQPNGASWAAAGSVLMGLVTLALVHLTAQASQGLQARLGRAAVWLLPGAEHLGAYLGLEGVGLLAWLGSWLLLHGFLRKKAVNGRAALILFLAGMGIATLLLWPPLVHVLLSKG
jgi:hypothetical protein